MDKVKRHNKILSITFAVVIAICLCLSFMIKADKVYAGECNRQILVDDFNKGINTNYWYTYNNNNDLIGVSPEKNSLKGLTCVDAQGATGIVSSAIISDGAILEIEILKFNFNANVTKDGCGWLSFIFGTNISNTDFVDYENLNTGKIMLLCPNYSGGHFFWEVRSYNEKFTFVDGSGNELTSTTNRNNYCVADDSIRNFKAYENGVFSWQSFKFPSSFNTAYANGITDTTLIITYQKDGSISIAYRGIDEDETQNKVVFKTTNEGKLDGFYNGKVGTSICGSDDIGYDTVFRGVNVYKLQNGIKEAKPTARIHDEDELSPLKDFEQYQSPKASELFYGQVSLLEFKKSQGLTGNKNFTLMSLSQEIKDDALIEKGNFVFEADLGLNEIKGNKIFGIVVGLDSARRNFKQNGASFIYIYEQAGDYKVGIKQYGNDSESDLIVGGVVLPIVKNEEFRLKITINQDKKVVLEIDGNIINIGNITIQKLAGYCGIAVDGANTDENNYVNFTVDNLSVINRVYVKSVYDNVKEDFKDNEFNANAWTTPEFGGNIRQKSTGVYVEDEKLKFDEVNLNANITSKGQYSNFEFTFDIVDILREPELDANGEMVKPASSWVGVMFQIPNLSYLQNYYYLVNNYKCPFFVFSVYENYIDGAIPENSTGRISLYNMGDEDVHITLPSEYNMFSKDLKGITMTVKTEMTDGLLKVSMKRSDKAEWFYPSNAEVDLQEGFDIISSVSGHISVRGYGEGKKTTSSSFLIDNLEIKNTDKEVGRLMAFEEKSNILPSSIDYEYVTVLNKDNLLEDGNNKKNTDGTLGSISKILPYVCIAVVVVVGVIVTVIIVRRKKKCIK